MTIWCRTQIWRRGWCKRRRWRGRRRRYRGRKELGQHYRLSPHVIMAFGHVTAWSRELTSHPRPSIGNFPIQLQCVSPGLPSQYCWCNCYSQKLLDQDLGSQCLHRQLYLLWKLRASLYFEGVLSEKLWGLNLSGKVCENCKERSVKGSIFGAGGLNAR